MNETEFKQLNVKFEPIYQNFDVVRHVEAVKFGKSESVSIANEFISKLTINNQFQIIIQSSPRLLPELIVGYLFAEGFIESINVIEKIDLKLVDGKAEISVQLKNFPNLIDKNLELRTSGQIGFNVSSLERQELIINDMKIDKNIIFQAQKYLFDNTILWKSTGGAHMAGLYNKDGTPIIINEDVARHNTIDKIIGRGLIEGINFSETFAIISGRSSTSMVNKIIRAKIPILASRAAPLSGGVDGAIVANLTMIGFVRDPEFNIYSNPERIL